MDLDVLLEAKTKELKELQEKKIHSLNEEIRCQESQLQHVREQYNELKDNFEYNLDLLNERDFELTKYDQVIMEMNEKIGSHLAEISDIKVELASTKQKLSEETAQKEEMTASFQNRLKDLEMSLQHQYKLKEEKVSNELIETARVKQQLQLQLNLLQEDNERKRREWERNFEEEISQLSRDHSNKLSEINNKLFQAESKLKQVVGEREALRLTVSELQSTVTAQDKHISQMESAVQEAEWNVNNYVNIQQAKITELESNNTQLQDELARREQVLANKISVCEVRLGDKDKTIQGLRSSHESQTREYRSQIHALDTQLEQMKLTSKSEVVRLEDQIAVDKDTISSLQNTIKEGSIELETVHQKLVRQEVNVKMEEQRCEEKAKELKIELERRKQDIARYKMDLALAAKREEAIRSEKEQEIKEMIRRCESTESRVYGSQEDVVNQICLARDKALADVKRINTDLGIKDDEIQLLRGQLSRLQNNELPNEESNNEQTVILRDQNEKLKDVIRQMTQEMQTLATNQVMSDSDHKTQEMSQTDESHRPDTHIPVVRNSSDEECDALRSEVVYLRKMIVAQKNKELDSEDLASCKARLGTIEKERDRLLELSNSLRNQLNKMQDTDFAKKGVPLKDVTARINTARSSVPISARTINKRPSSSSQPSLLHMSGDTSLNEELSDICRLVESEENRPLSNNTTLEGEGLQVISQPAPTISPPKLVMGPTRTRVKTTKPKPKVRNYNQK